MSPSSLRLIPFAPHHLLTLIENPDRFQEDFGYPAADGLRGLFVSDDVSPAWLAHLKASKDADPWRFGFGLVDTDGVVVGSAGFKGPPDEDGVVEIAYGVVPGAEGRGLATQAAMGLIEYAKEDGRATLVRAHTLPERNASTRVLEKCGFDFVGEVIDPEDGAVWRWEWNDLSVRLPDTHGRKMVK